MGCVNTNSKRASQKSQSNRELQLQDSWKIKALQHKNSKTVGNEHMPTHDSIPQDYSIDLQWSIPVQMRANFTQQNDNEQKRSESTSPTGKKQKNLQVKLNSQFDVNREKGPQATQIKREKTNLLSSDSSEDKKFKKDYRLKQVDQIVFNNQRFPSKQQKNALAIKIDRQVNNTQIHSDEEQTRSLGQIKQVANSESFLSQMKRQKRPGFRSPRGRSCNLFKTFEDDYIEDEPQLEIKRRSSKSLEI